ncbi:EF-P beta-lysylation protein EpmB, partial [Klebsiella pneumoniae]|nr:EF-P beta-lysylation protein EpmB [Klebsiella pneumoniae]
MQKGNINDPLLRQVLPIAEECIKTPDYSVDPLRELAVNPLPGLLHKYHGRVLLTIAGACGVNC